VFKTVKWFWFKDMMSMFGFILKYPEEGFTNEVE
jgi:hypothetical protein